MCEIVFTGLDHAKIGNRFAVVQRVVADHQAQIHFDVATVVVVGSVPLAVEADDHIAAIPERGAEVHLLALVISVDHRPRRDIFAAQAEARGFDPVLEIV